MLNKYNLKEEKKSCLKQIKNKPRMKKCTKRKENVMKKNN
jgi:uncharacterized pyridoxamine 5'-phosphate oxidase family protein